MMQGRLGAALILCVVLMVEIAFRRIRIGVVGALVVYLAGGVRV